MLDKTQGCSRLKLNVEIRFFAFVFGFWYEFQSYHWYNFRIDLKGANLLKKIKIWVVNFSNLTSDPTEGIKFVNNWAKIEPQFCCIEYKTRIKTGVEVETVGISEIWDTTKSKLVKSL